MTARPKIFDEQLFAKGGVLLGGGRAAAEVGTDGTVGGPSGTALSPSVENGRAGPASGDATGATDTTALEAAIAANKGLIKLRGEAYYVTKLPVCEPGKKITAEPGCVVYLVGKGTCLRLYNPAFPTTGGVAEFTNNMAGICSDLVIDMTYAESGAVGVRVGDIYMPTLIGVVVRNVPTGAKGWLFKSEIGWSERLLALNCHAVGGLGDLVTFDNGGAGTGSFDYSHIELSLQASTNQNGLVMVKAVEFYGLTMKINGNFFTGVGSNTGIAWQIGMDGSRVLIPNGHIDWQVESDGMGVAHNKIEMGTEAEVHAFGVLDFFGEGFKKSSSNVSQPNAKFTFAGFVRVGTSIGLNQAGEALNVVGGSTWSKGFSPVSEGKVEVGVNAGDYFEVTLASGSNVLKLLHAFAGRARRIVLVLKQPGAGAPGTVDWTNPGNNTESETAQQIIWANTSAPALASQHGAVNVLQLVTVDGTHWYANLLEVTKTASWQPEDQSLKGWSFDPVVATVGQAPETAGKVHFARLKITRPTNVSNILVQVITTAGKKLTVGQCFAGLYNSAVELLAATVDQASAWETTGLKTMALTEAKEVAAGEYIIAFFWNGETGPNFARGATTPAINAGVSGASSRYGTANTGNTTAMPTKLESQGAESVAWWVAVS